MPFSPSAADYAGDMNAFWNHINLLRNNGNDAHADALIAELKAENLATFARQSNDSIQDLIDEVGIDDLADNDEHLAQLKAICDSRGIKY